MNAQTTCFECNLPHASHNADGKVFVVARFLGGAPKLYCAGFVSRPASK